MINLDDDNGDGSIDSADLPEIVFTTHCSGGFSSNGVIRAIHASGPSAGNDYFAACGSTVWHEGDPLSITCACADATANPSSGLAVGDLDNDGTPEIVVVTEDNRIQILDNTGAIISTSGITGFTYSAPAPSIANVDNAGFAEIIIGRHMFTLEHDLGGMLRVLDTFTGNLSSGISGISVVSCVADITGDSRLEIVAGTSLYAFPRPATGIVRQADCTGTEMGIDAVAFCNGELLVIWDGALVNSLTQTEGLCAIADVLGIDTTIAPSPSNPLNGQPEVILVGAGKILIFDGGDGTLHLSLTVGGDGGAPTIEDFDGDGFPEIGSAFDSRYVLFDLQDTSPQCPAWPVAPLDDLTSVESVNTARTPPTAACTQDSDCSALDSGTVCNETTGSCICLHNGWVRRVENNSTPFTGSSSFDFDGNGAAEALFHDECRMRLYEGLDGTVWFREASESRARIAYGVVADVDNDGAAELVFPTTNDSGFCSEGLVAQYNNGIEVWDDSGGIWTSALRIWNEYSFHIDNSEEDASIPFFELPGWLFHNSYRAAQGINEADFSVVKSDDTDPVIVGSQFIYNITVTNGGPAEATAGLIDPLPAGISFVSVATSQGTCSESVGQITCDLGSVLSGSSVTISISVTANSIGTVTNSTTVSSMTPDPDGFNNTASEQTIVVAAATIGDSVWEDLDGDGVQDPGEPRMPNVLVSVFDGGGAPVAADFTDGIGNYSFGGLSTVTPYFLRFTPPVGFVLTLQDQGVDDALDSDVDPITLSTMTFTPSSPTDDTRWDAGMIPFCIPPDEPVFIAGVSSTNDGNAFPVLHIQDPNQSNQLTGYNVYRSSDPGLPPASWALVASDIVDMDEGTPNIQWVDASGDVSPTGVWFYDVAAFNARCPVEGPR